MHEHEHQKSDVKLQDQYAPGAAQMPVDPASVHTTEVMSTASVANCSNCPKGRSWRLNNGRCEYEVISNGSSYWYPCR